MMKWQCGGEIDNSGNLRVSSKGCCWLPSLDLTIPFSIKTTLECTKEVSVCQLAGGFAAQFILKGFRLLFHWALPVSQL